SPETRRTTTAQTARSPIPHRGKRNVQALAPSATATGASPPAAAHMPIPPDLGVHDPHPDQFAPLRPAGPAGLSRAAKGEAARSSPPPARQRIAIFYTKPCNRLLRPLAA